MPRSLTLVLLIATAASLLLAGCGQDSSATNSNRRANPASPEPTFRTVEIDDISDRIEAGEVLLVDVRTQQEWDLGRAARATHIPLAEVDERIDEIRDVADDRPVVFICRTGRRSAEAAAIAADAGIEDVSNIDGGMQAWVDAGLPLDPPDGRVAS